LTKTYTLKSSETSGVASLIENQKARSTVLATAATTIITAAINPPDAHPRQSFQQPITGTATSNTSNNALYKPEGSNESPAEAEVPFDEPPIVTHERDHWNIALSKLEFMLELTYKQFNGEWIYVKQKYQEYERKEIKDKLVESVDYFNTTNNHESLKSYAYSTTSLAGLMKMVNTNPYQIGEVQCRPVNPSPMNRSRQCMIFPGKIM
jgi:hypothetical protein